MNGTIQSLWSRASALAPAFLVVTLLGFAQLPSLFGDALGIASELNADVPTDQGGLEK